MLHLLPSGVEHTDGEREFRAWGRIFVLIGVVQAVEELLPESVLTSNSTSALPRVSSLPLYCHKGSLL